MVWTRERVDTLETMWRAGHSAATIAERLGCSRNAVIGKVHRLGLADQDRSRAVRRTARRPGTSRRAAFRRRKTPSSQDHPRAAHVQGSAPAPVITASAGQAGETSPAPSSAPPRALARLDTPAAPTCSPRPGPPAVSVVSLPHGGAGPVPGGVSLSDLKAGQCRYALDARDDVTWLFCGAATVSPSSSYCAAHHAAVWVAPDPDWKRRRRRWRAGRRVAA